VEQESIPDNLLESAKEVVVVDVTPETLELRLQDGKIYPPDKIKSQVQNLFLHRNLLELRELALRQVADKIEQEGIQEANLLCGNGHAEISLISCCDRLLKLISI
jgi:two-component system, OmpR family, sensor histidine kinase KdpD